MKASKLIPINKIFPYKKNPRVNENAVDAVAQSIKDYGFRQPIVVDKKMIIIVGHTRLLAAKKLGLKKVPVLIADDLTPRQVKAYRIADNKTNEFASWDYELLGDELKGLENYFTGFGEAEIINILNSGDREFDPNKEWVNMPEFDQEDKTSYRHIVVHFKSEEDIKKFARATRQKITEKTRTIWYPEIEIGTTADKEYV